MASILERSLAAQRRQIDAFVAKAGYSKPGSIPEEMTFRQWCGVLAAKGMKVDRKPFSLVDRPALVPIYDAIPTTREEASGRLLVVQKATQLGLTVWEVLADLYMALKWGPVNIGMFLPDQNTAAFKSEHRFMPILRSAPTLYQELTHRTDDDGKRHRIGEGNVLTRQFANSLLMFLWTSGKVSTESRPMDVVSLDECQEMALSEIDKVRARCGDSPVNYTLMLSTANMPDQDINFWYKEGSQEVWHTRCPSCEALSDLSDPAGTFPGKSITYNDGRFPKAPADDYVWTCPACGGWIEDPQQGVYIAEHPAADPLVRSFLLPRTISPRMTPRLMFTAWSRARTGDQKKSFWNRTLARPYIDADQLPVTMAHCLACVEEGKKLGLKWEKSGRDCVAGIDQMGSFNCVIVKKRLSDNRQAVVHVEAIFDDDPFARCDEIMEEYGISVCVLEQLPNVNDARRFANRHPGRVFLASYSGDAKADMVTWGDALSDNDRKTAAEDRSRFAATLQQYKAMQLALYRVRDKFCLFPDPNLLEQDVLDGGERKRIPILRDWVFFHLTKTALVVEDTEGEKPQKGKAKSARNRRMKVAKTGGIDPHFAFANMLCDIAWSRNWGTGSFIMPDAKDTPSTPLAEIVAAAIPGLSPQVMAMMHDTPAGSCGRCSAFAKPDQCEMRGFAVKPDDAGCPLFDRAE